MPNQAGMAMSDLHPPILLHVSEISGQLQKIPSLGAKTATPIAPHSGATSINVCHAGCSIGWAFVSAVRDPGNEQALCVIRTATRQEKTRNVVTLAPPRKRSLRARNRIRKA